MPVKNKLAVFFSLNSLSIVETQRQKILNSFDASHSLFDETYKLSAGNVPNEIKLTAIIQKSLRDRKISTSEAYLALPTHEIILRSFYIPWMTTAEVKGVVDFEARRYIPFKLEELVYGYHAITVMEKKNRRIRILFIAVRKETLERYCSILEEAGLTVTFAEPETLSLLRVLGLKKYLHRQKKYAVVQLDRAHGTLIIVDQDIPQFLRDFRPSPSSGTLSTDQNSLVERLVKEIRMSLDYYRRQYSQSHIDHALIISEAEISTNAKNLSDDLGIPVTVISPKALYPHGEISLGALNAYGATLRDEISTPFKIDLALSRARPTEPEKPLEQTPVTFAMTIKVAVMAALCAFVVFMISGNKVSQSQKRLDTLQKKIGVYDAFTMEELKQKEKTETDKLLAYKNIRLKSQTAFFLSRIPKLLPKGSWLTQMRINYSDATPASLKISGEKATKVTIYMEGYLYWEDLDQQISGVNSLIASLRNDEELAKNFQDIVLTGVQKETLGDYTVTRFQINCN